MPLTVGSRLGHYEVTALIGEGGMGQVYQATDTKLNRQVALKILPEVFATDPDRLARFQREAQVLASLNHPNIAAIHGLEESEGTRALVLELVEGSTLADRIAKGAIPVDEALPIAKQIAEALEAAHEAGVIHRDLKPANIKVRDDGTVKVLDFGLAKALDATPGGDPSESPTLTAAATQMGVIMGTAAYMSPEQARGKTVDKRADIWAFGAVLYEMLTGQRAFAGTDVTDTLAAVVRAEPEWHLLPDAMGPSLRVFMQRCLEKDAKHRVGDVHDVRLALEGAFESTAPLSGTVPQPQVWQRPVVAVALVGVVGGRCRGWVSGLGNRHRRRRWCATSVATLHIPAPGRGIVGTQPPHVCGGVAAGNGCRVSRGYATSSPEPRRWRAFHAGWGRGVDEFILLLARRSMGWIRQRGYMEDPPHGRVAAASVRLPTVCLRHWHLGSRRDNDLWIGAGGGAVVSCVRVRRGP